MELTKSVKSKEWLTVPDFIARHQGLIGRSSIYNAIQNGSLPHVRIGRRVLVPSDALERLLKNGHTVDAG